MGKISILGVDPSLRNTGLCVVSYDPKLSLQDPAAFTVTGANVLVNPKQFTGTDAILNMLDMICDESLKTSYCKADQAIIESPALMFNKKISSSVVASIAHISGGCVVAFGIERARIYRPSEWNKSRRKDVTHANTQIILGNYSTWGYERKIKNEKQMEHILDAASMALWWIRANYLED